MGVRAQVAEVAESMGVGAALNCGTAADPVLRG